MRRCLLSGPIVIAAVAMSACGSSDGPACGPGTHLDPATDTCVPDDNPDARGGGDAPGSADAMPTSHWVLKIPKNDPGSPLRRQETTGIWTGSSLLIFGGSGPTGPLNDVWSYAPDTNSWTNLVPDDTPSGPLDPGPTVWTGTHMLMPSRSSGVGMAVWLFEPGSATWALDHDGTGTAPANRDRECSTWTGAELLYFGGVNGSTQFREVWSYSTETHAWTLVHDGLGVAPGYMFDASLAWNGSEALLFTPRGGVWSFDPTTNTWTERSYPGANSSPSSRQWAGWTWDGQDMVLFGGIWTGVRYADTYLFSPADDAWSLEPHLSPEPSARFGSVFSWDGTEAILFGGTDLGSTNDLWWWRRN